MNTQTLIQRRAIHAYLQAQREADSVREAQIRKLSTPNMRPVAQAPAPAPVPSWLAWSAIAAYSLLMCAISFAVATWLLPMLWRLP